MEDCRIPSGLLVEEEFFLVEVEERFRFEDARRESRLFGREDDLFLGEDDLVLGDDDEPARGDLVVPLYDFTTSLFLASLLSSGQKVEQIQRIIMRNTVNNPAPHAHDAEVHLSG